MIANKRSFKTFTQIIYSITVIAGLVVVIMGLSILGRIT
jgi:hypothetical protein